MIGRQIKGRGFRGLVEYLAGKEGASILAGNLLTKTPREIASELEQVRSLRPTLRRAVFHMPIRPAPGEQLTDSQWREVAERTIAGMGFSGSPWIAYLHRDAREVHLHLVASRIAYNGSIVSDANDYARAQRILRAIERDYGLRAVGASDQAKPPRSSERQRSERTGEVSTREQLRQSIIDASRGGPSVAGFLERLRSRGIEVQFRVAPRGQVTGISYRSGPQAFAGYSLGPAFTWRGLQTRLGVRFDPARDLPAIFAARRGLLPSSPSSFPSQEDSMAEPPGTEPTRAQATRTEESVRRHLRALGAERFDLVVLQSSTGEREVRTGWDAAQIERSLDWLRHQNAAGAEILVRPSRPSPAIVVELPKTAVERLREKGFEAAAIVEVGRDRSAPTKGSPSPRVEVWLRHAEPVTREEAAFIAPSVAQALGSRPEGDRSDFGHLAGFTSPLAAQPGEQAPYAHLSASPGVVYRQSDEQLDQARSLLQDRSARHEVEKELGLDRRDSNGGGDYLALERLAREAGLPPAQPLIASEIETELSGIASARERFLQLQALAPPEDLAAAVAREREVINAFRTLRSREQDLEAATGLWPLPENVDTPAIREAQGIETRFQTAAARLETATDRALLAPSPAHEAALGEAASARDAAEAARAEWGAQHAWRPAESEELARAALDRYPITRLGEATESFDWAAENLDASRPDSRDAFAAAFVERLDATLAFEELRADLAQARLAVAADLHRATAQVENLEAALPARPERALLERLGERIEKVESTQLSLEAITERLRGVDLGRFERDLERVARSFELAPSVEKLQEYSALIAAQHDLLRHRESEPPIDSARTLATPRPEAPEVAEARAQLAREATRTLEEPSLEQLASFRFATERLLDLRAKVEDTAIRSEFLAARAELRQAFRELRPEGSQLPLSEAATVRYRDALERFQEAEARWAGHLKAAWPIQARRPDPDRLLTLLERVRRGDQTPETLAELHRATVHTLSRATGRPVAPATQAPREDLLAAGATFRQAQLELLRAARGLPSQATDPKFLPQLDRIRLAVGAFQGAAKDLQEVTDRFTQTSERRLPLRHFLEHPDFARAPVQALAAWARHAARHGSSEPRIAAHLSRALPRSRIAVPRFLGQRASSAIAYFGVRGAYQHLRSRLHDLEHSR